MGTKHDGTTILDHDQNTPSDVATSDAEAAEAIAEMLGDPLPPDWQEAHAVEGRQECLAASAYAAADAALELIVVRSELQRRREVGSVDAPEVQQAVRALLDLDRAWRTYAHTTQRDDAAAIVYSATEYWAGATIAALIEGSIEAIWADRRQRVLGAAPA